ncbi:unnamed protein product [Pylaiella littoralis]
MPSLWGRAWSSRRAADSSGSGGGSSNGGPERDGEREPLAPSGSGRHASMGAFGADLGADNADVGAGGVGVGAAAADTTAATSSSGGGGMARRTSWEPKPRSSPTVAGGGFLRGMMAMPTSSSNSSSSSSSGWAKKQQQQQQQVTKWSEGLGSGNFHNPQAEASALASASASPSTSPMFTTRGRAASSAAWTKSLDEAGGIAWGRRRAGLSPDWALERRSSAGGYEGLPEMPKLSSGNADHTGSTGASLIALPKRRSVRIHEMSEEDALTRAITSLEDALGYRDPDYYTDARSIRSYRFRQSRAWQSCTSLAVLAYIAACFLGTPPFSADWDGMPPLSALQKEVGQTWGLCLECGCVLFFAFDMYLLYRCVGVRSIVTCWWKVAFLLSLLLSVTDLGTRWYTHRPWSRVFRPAVFFFVGPKVRNCSLSTLHAVSALLPVLVLELLVTLAYSCVCVVLYHGVKDAPFTTLGSAFINLFALSTTVNDPDVWLPLYDRNRANVLVFVSFLVVQVFLLHNILLASVWNEFGERMKLYAKQKRKWREESVRRAFEALDLEGTGHITRETVMKLLKKIRPHYGESKRYMMYERIVQSTGLRGRGGGQGAGGRRRVANEHEAAEVTQVYRRDFCNNVVEALSLKIRTMRERNIASTGQYLLLPLYVWNVAFVMVSCAMSPWVFNTGIFWLTLLPTSTLLGASILAELVMTGVRAYIVLPWNRVKTLSLFLTAVGLLWFIVFTSPKDWGRVFTEERHGKSSGANLHMQVSIGCLMSARCLDLGTLLKLVPAIHDVVSVMYMITPSVFAQAGVIFTLFHVYCYLGMALYGGVVTPGADFGDTPFANSPYYYENNFNSYPEGLVTLFELLVVNNWNMIITGYIHASPLGMWTYLYFLSFITLAVTLALNVLTAIFMTAFTTAAKSNSNTRGGGHHTQSMTSDKARTALGAGASLALRPTPVAGSYFSSHSDLGASADSGSNDAHGRTRSYNYEEGVDGALEAAGSAVVTDDGNGGGNGNGSGTASGNGHNAGVGGGGGGVGYGLFRIGFGPFGRGSARPGEGGKGTINKSSIGSDAAGSSSSSSAGGGGGGGAGGEAGGALGGINEDMPPPPPRPPLADAAKKAAGDVGAPAPAAAAVTRFPDPFQQLPTRLSGLPEHEEVVPKSPRASLDAATQDLDLGWGKGSQEPPEPPPASAGPGGRTRWGSGHFYKVSRRNSYSDRDMFEGGEDEEDVPMKILGAISIGLGNTMGIRACMLRHKQPRSRGEKNPSWQGDGEESSGEDELEHPESHLMFESSGFRRMVAPHLPIKPGGKALGLAQEDEGWEAMAMRDELTDVMLHSAFGDAIFKECPPPPPSPNIGSSRSGTPAFGGKATAATAGAALPISATAPPLPSSRLRAGSTVSEGEEEEDFDLPKDLGIRTWTKALTKEQRAKRMTGLKSKTAILSVQCVLAARNPVPVVVYTAKPVQ